LEEITRVAQRVFDEKMFDVIDIPNDAGDVEGKEFKSDDTQKKEMSAEARSI
jgi:hypothetical protein